MHYGSIDEFLRGGQAALAKGPVALIFCEDEVEIASTIAHHRRIGFAQVVLISPPRLPLPPEAEGLIAVDCDLSARNAVPAALSRVIARCPPTTWLYWGYNAEYLIFPFCESRQVGEMLAFHSEERRAAMLAYVIDLYAADLGRFPNAVSRDEALFDSRGYYALERFGGDGKPLERQFDVFGGIRWRYEEHIPWARRRLDRTALLRPAKGLEMRPDFTLSDEEMNTVSCPWHHNLTAAVASFRTAKALKTNPGSSWAIGSFAWAGSARFEWTSRQLLDLGMIEPGQWF